MSSNGNSTARLVSNRVAIGLKEQLLRNEREKGRFLEAFREEIIASDDKLVTSVSSISDSQLLKFLRAKRFDVGKSFDSFRRYIEFVSNHFQLLASPDDVRVVFDDNLLVILDERTSLGEAVFVGRPGKWDPNKFSYDTYTSAVILTCETAALDETTQINGIVYVVDMTGFGLKHLLHFGPFQAKRTADLSETILPMRFNQIHVIHESRLARVGFNVMKPFLSAEFKSKIFFHGNDLDALSERLGATVSASLPPEFGGRASGARLDSSNWFKRIVAAQHTLRSLWEAHVVIH